MLFLFVCFANGGIFQRSFSLQPSPRSNKVDAQVIDGHIIPGHVLFTAPTPSNRPYETLAFGDNLKVTISFSTERGNKGIDKCEYFFFFYLHHKLYQRNHKNFFFFFSFVRLRQIGHACR